MSRKTTNLDLTLSGPDDSSMDYQTYEYSQSGYTGSNMTKIDEAIGAPLSTLSTNAKKIIPSINEVQGSVLVISNDRGYINPKQIEDANLLLKSGKYTSVKINTPTNDLWNIEVIEHNSEFVTQVATKFATSGGFSVGCEMYIRNRSVGVWQGWKQLATTEKMEVLTLPFNSGLSELGANYTCRLTKNESLKKATIYCAVKKTDGSNFSPNVATRILTFPVGYTSIFNFALSGSATNINSTPIGSASINVHSNNIDIFPFVACQGIIFSFSYDIP
ncbi:MAG: pyocin knob domain-containing protein [Bacteroidales bacterium]